MAIIMMFLGFIESWILWQAKNILSIMFFAGIGILNINLIIINISYMILSIYIFIKSFKASKLKKIIAITGPGCSGKSTLLQSKIIQKYIYENHITLIDERPYLKGDDPYTSALTNNKNFYLAQEMFFCSQKDMLEQAELEGGNQYSR
ncbi:hypothetical protein HGG64_01070 [Mycoplasma phocoeninasale]|uniref:Uncharacterized protein n=1 Tax=Mycoplasma phocoeninasale TaxID=2726117 RepID=A0A858TZT3_9MOLU|nr:hypothetical protein [Mycoplasma phocoeninasale]QJG66304.1 hypothetical protein HGG64_01070 [Mycoplasma phocoeninasale]